MSHYKLNLKPGGLIPRDTGLTLQMKDLPVELVPDVVIPKLHVDAGVQPWGENRFSSIVVWTDDIQLFGLDVTLEVDDDHILTIFDVPTSSFLAKTTITIPAGSSSVNVLSHTPGGFAAGDTTLLATASGYSPVTRDFKTSCSHIILGVHYSVISLSASAAARQVSDNIHNTMTITNHRAVFIAGWLNITDACEEDAVTWAVSGTGGGDIGLNVQSQPGLPFNVDILAAGSLFGGSDYVSGATIKVECRNNGTALDNALLGTYTFTFA